MSVPGNAAFAQALLARIRLETMTPPRDDSMSQYEHLQIETRPTDSVVDAKIKQVNSKWKCTLTNHDMSIPVTIVGSKRKNAEKKSKEASCVSTLRIREEV